MSNELQLADAADAEAYVYPTIRSVARNADTEYRPLKPAELDVLRAQYEKEGEYVGVQTKFNYAWVLHTTFASILNS
jgi:hypothetical protein